MHKPRLFAAGLFASCFFLLAGIAQAQQPVSAVGSSPSPEKVALIKQMLELANPKKTVEAILKAQAEEMEKELPEITWQSVSNMNELTSLTPAEREKLHEEVVAGARDLNRRIYDTINKRLDFSKIIEDISIPLYDKYFTESELKDLLAFYQSPTGKKVVDVMPQLTTEAMTQTSQVLAPQLIELVKQIEREETERMKKQVLEEAAKPKPKTTPSKRPASRRKTQ